MQKDISCQLDGLTRKSIAIFLWHHRLLQPRQIFDFIKARSVADVNRLWMAYHLDKHIQSGHDAASEGKRIQADYRHAHVEIMTCVDDNYPEKMKSLTDMPPVLAIKGNPALLNDPQIAIVGSRQLHPESPRICRTIAENLVQKGYILTSGGALGIDALTHRTAMVNKVPTIVVTGTGPDEIYPIENRDIFEYAEAYGAIVSQFPMNTPAKKHNFPVRNSIIAALSEATLIIQCGIQSGALYTARFARKIRRPVWVAAMPGFEPLTEGGLGLVNRGEARLISNMEDLKHFAALSERKNIALQRELFETETLGIQDKIIITLEKSPMTREQLRGALEGQEGDIDDALLEMELSGMVRQAGGLYRLCWSAEPYPVKG